ncbi:hypothetical protein GJV85_03560 [Sulfurimonas aquatica]|uniref:Gfo/Idh/MocA family oxidoreductase n=1 Tax=Sulfurimonas aquatica TaxID=2672570 RepID=A0A975GC77_9BACT|nr:Gfo/Idh/MocA family oxidoreductase [Sulfurimonas aquatica]QSZ41227.1 hypothetical protein GJV85_03560 [Sulfurimonas aquatica]
MAIRGIICGAGSTGTHLHYGALIAAGADIVAFVDINEEMAKKASKQYGLNSYYTSIEEALQNEKNIDFVDICTSSATHLSIAKVSLEHGCNVLVEKPVTETIEEIEELRKLKERYSKVVCAVHNHKFYPSVREVRNMIKSGEIGDIISINKEMSFNWEDPGMMEEDHWAQGIPGGRLFEANPHNLYIIYSLIGKFELVDIFPRKVSSHWVHAKVDEFQAIFKTDKTTINLKMSMHSTKESYGKYGPNFFVVVGTKKSVLFDYANVVELNDFSGSIKRNIKVKNKFTSEEKYPIIKDKNGDECNIGVDSGHKWIIDKFIGNLEGRYTEEAVSFGEAFFVQAMNSKMGNLVEAKLARQ